METLLDMRAVLAEINPTGTLRVGVVFAPEVSTFFVVVGDALSPRGPTVDLGRALASALGADVEFVIVPNSGELVDGLERGAMDVAFMPMDEERKRRLAFGPSYFIIESTGLVRADSKLETTNDLNQVGVRVAGIANTTTIRNAARVLPLATMVTVESVADAMEALQSKSADAVALSRDVLQVYQSAIPGTRIVNGTLHTTGIAVAVPKHQPTALSFVSEFLERAKSAGVVRKAFDDAGLSNDAVAPEGA